MIDRDQEQRAEYKERRFGGADQHWRLTCIWTFPYQYKAWN